ncbi:MAG: DHH family phosphoesterase [Candidatus Woesearchaeota archaeon]|jgi:single-stranded DNA-specific DHH superfamily exonuclease
MIDFLPEFAAKADSFKSYFLDAIKIRKKFYIITHKDCDGVSSAYILTKILNALDCLYDIKTCTFIDEKTIYELAKTIECENIIFLDLGSSYLDIIADAFFGMGEKKNVFVIDHHHIKAESKEIVQLNAREFGVDSDAYMCGATTVYFFAKQFSDVLSHEELNKLALVATLGAIGDYQAKDNIEGLNKIAIDEGISSGMITLEKDLNIYGKESRYLHKCLARCDFDVPGIKSEHDAMDFVIKNGFYEKGRWTKYNELSTDEKERLKKKILELRNGNNEKVFSNSIMFYVGDKNNKRTIDAFEFSTLINSKIRMDDDVTAIKLCSFDEEVIKKAKKELFEYQTELKKNLEYIDSLGDNKDKNNTQKYTSDNIVIINLFDKIKPNFISTVSSIIGKSRKYPDGTLLFLIGRINPNESKISARVCGLSKQNKINVKELLEVAMKGITTNLGGHFESAGAIISTFDEEKTIENLKNIKI